MVTLAFSTRLPGFTKPALEIAKGKASAVVGNAAKPMVAIRALHNTPVKIPLRLISFMGCLFVDCHERKIKSGCRIDNDTHFDLGLGISVGSVRATPFLS